MESVPAPLAASSSAASSAPAKARRPVGVMFAILGTLVTLMLFGMVILGLMLTRAPDPSTVLTNGSPAAPAPNK